jgi:hypothetical protein
VSSAPTAATMDTVVDAAPSLSARMLVAPGATLVVVMRLLLPVAGLLVVMLLLLTRRATGLTTRLLQPRATTPGVLAMALAGKRPWRHLLLVGKMITDYLPTYVT